MGGTEVDEQKRDVITAKGAQEIIARGVKRGVSIVHIEPTRRFVIVRYRHGGSLYTAAKLPISTATSLANYFKKKAGLVLSQTKAPQTGDYTEKLARKSYTVLVSTLPTLDGEKLTIELSSANSVSPTLAELGMWGKNLSTLEAALAQPYGLLIIAGRQVAQSATLLNSILELFGRFTQPRLFISSSAIAVPDGVKHVIAQPGSGWSIARHAALALRQDFPIIAIDAIVNQESAEILPKLAEDKRLVITSVPVESASRGLVFLNRACRDKAMLTNIRAIVGQSFLRTLCPRCRESYSPSTQERHQLDKYFHLQDTDIMHRIHELEQQAQKDGLSPALPLSSTSHKVERLWRRGPTGCKDCDQTGLSDQIGLYEVCIPSDHLSGLVEHHAALAQIQNQAVKGGMVSLQIDGLIKALRGYVDIGSIFALCAGR